MPRIQGALLGIAGCLAAATALSRPAMAASPIQHVFVIAFENHDWIQPTQKFGGQQQQIEANPAAPFINSLVQGTATAMIGGQQVNISGQVAYTDTYHNVLATVSGHNKHIHPSEPNYIWAEAGTNFGVLNDNDPYDPSGPTDVRTSFHLTSLLFNAGLSWKSYQEDTDVSLATDTPRAPGDWTVPLTSFSGNFTQGGLNPYNGSRQYHYAAKHDPQVFFRSTNGGNNSTPSNPEAHFYAPMQQLYSDLAHDNVANYNWITPNEYNDMHTSLAGGFVPPGSGQHLYGDRANIAQGDNFARMIIPAIMASPVYKNSVIVLWWDEAESVGNENADDFTHSIPEIIISPFAHANVNGLPYDAIKANYSHSSDLLTWQEVFGVGPCLHDACNATDLSDLFAPGVIPSGIAGF